MIDSSFVYRTSVSAVLGRYNLLAYSSTAVSTLFTFLLIVMAPVLLRLSVVDSRIMRSRFLHRQIQRTAHCCSLFSLRF